MTKWKAAKVQWHDADSDPTAFNDIIERLKSNNLYEIHVGCDSHKIGGVYIFAVVIAGYVQRRGGTFFFHRKRSKDNALSSISFRLMKEAELALEIAHSLNAAFPLRDINVHLDINPDKRFASSKVLTNAVSWVNSYGYNVFIKPNAWASSSLADAFAK
jgi:predicted RNase H-related nuclease YkuK (DUF458 family)|tara:strand:+ start:3162 stop:3638 length:477 start_codon:yes stop_codon:yes gene_type:complete